MQQVSRADWGRLLDEARGELIMVKSKCDACAIELKILHITGDGVFCKRCADTRKPKGSILLGNSRGAGLVKFGQNDYQIIDYMNDPKQTVAYFSDQSAAVSYFTEEFL